VAIRKRTAAANLREADNERRRIRRAAAPGTNDHCTAPFIEASWAATEYDARLCDVQSNLGKKAAC